MSVDYIIYHRLITIIAEIDFQNRTNNCRRDVNISSKLNATVVKKGRAMGHVPSSNNLHRVERVQHAI